MLFKQPYSNFVFSGLQGQGMSQLGNELEMLRKLKGPGIINLAGNF